MQCIKTGQIYLPTFLINSSTSLNLFSTFFNLMLIKTFAKLNHVSNTANENSTILQQSFQSFLLLEGERETKKCLAGSTKIDFSEN